MECFGIFVVLMVVVGIISRHRKPTLRTVLMLMRAGGEFKKLPDGSCENRRVRVKYSPTEGKSVELTINIRGYSRAVILNFFEGKLFQKMNIAEERIEGRVFEGHTRNFAAQILGIVDKLESPPQTS